MDMNAFLAAVDALRKTFGDVRIDLAAHEIIERCELCGSSSAYQHGIIFGVGVDVADQDVENHRIQQRNPGTRLNETRSSVEYLLETGAAARDRRREFVFGARIESEQLAEVLLMNSDDAPIRRL